MNRKHGWIVFVAYIAGILTCVLLNAVHAPRWTFPVIGVLAGLATYLALREAE
jgi:hypothetical protein